MTLRLVPLSQRQARAFVAEHHRHNGPDTGDVIRVGLEVDGEARRGWFRRQAESCRLAGRADARDHPRLHARPRERACSQIYGALCRAAAALGYERVITYTLVSESGASLRASGFTIDARIPARDWTGSPGRARYSANLFGERGVAGRGEDPLAAHRRRLAGARRVSPSDA